MKRIAFSVVLCFLTLFFIEGALQILALAGRLPALSFGSRVPYGRVYWSKEGLGNSRANRYGWYYPKDNYGADTHRIAIVGDSIVEAFQIHPSQHFGVHFERLLGTANRLTAADVLAFGISGSGPAHYLEIIKYVADHYGIDEVIVVLFLGNDFRNSSHRLQTSPSPQGYPYYVFDDNNQLRLHPDSSEPLEAFRAGIRTCHQPLANQLVGTIRSYLLLPKLLYHLRTINRPDRSEERADTPTSDQRPAAPEKRWLLGVQGLSAHVFEEPADELGKEAVALTLALLERCSSYCQDRNIDFRIVTIPIFPPAFYEQEDATDWTTRFGRCDLFLPDRYILEWAGLGDIKVVSMGVALRADNLGTEEVRGLFCNEGTGHLSVKGHEYVARLMSKAILDAALESAAP